MPAKTLYLVDGTSLCYRSFFAIKLSTSGGFPTGAVFGVYQTLKKILSKYKPAYLGFCFDISRKTHRQKKYKEYKIKRPPAPDGLTMQIPIIKELISSLGIRIVEKEGYEADDIIASFCFEATKDNAGVVIVSSDKDLYQLIETPGVSVYNYNKDVFIDKDGFLKEYGFSPQMIIDYLALAGDSTDNIPGARGIGKVGATRLIKEFGGVEDIFGNIDSLPSKTRDILLKSRKDIMLSRELVALHPCELDLGWQDLKIGEPDLQDVHSIFEKLEFKSLLKEIPKPRAQADVEIHKGVSAEDLRSLAESELVLFCRQREVFIFDAGHNRIYIAEAESIKDILEDDGVKKVSCDFKGQLAALSGIGLRGLWFDVKIAAYLLESSLVDYSLPTLVSHYLGEAVSSVSEQLAPYFIYRLYGILSEQLKQEKLDRLFFGVEIPLIYVLSKMQFDGVRVDAGVLRNLLKKIESDIVGTKEKVFKISKRQFNLNSPKQLAAVLFDELHIKPLKKLKTGYSTSEEVLDKLSSEHPVAGYVLEYRHLNKLKTTYINPLIEEVDKNEGILHTQFNQTATQTGRLSSSSPNLQSIPVKGQYSDWLREAFLSSFPQGSILSGDYSQIELRILAHLCEDPNLIKAFKEDIDIHNFTAALLFGVEPGEVNASQRDIAKRVNFGIIYGMSPYGLSKELKIGPEEAQSFIVDYFQRYPGVKNYIDRSLGEAEKEGFVQTILGRKRRLPDINSINVQLREFSRRQATNAPIQGSCADLIKIAMVRIYKELEEKKFATKLIIQIHDELIFDVHPRELSDIKELVKNHMQDSMQLKVPIKVNISCGRNWGQMKDVT
jgi:DNA polymerase-1